MDAPPTLEASNDGPVCVGLSVNLTAAVIDAGRGTYTYEWDFGDGSPTQPVASPTDVVPHTYAMAGPYTATIHAAHSTLSGCGSTSDTPVGIDPGIDPLGEIGNALRIYKSGSDLILDWETSPLDPRNYNVLRTESWSELPSTPTGMGDETRVDAPVTNRETATDAGVIRDGKLYFYEVWGANTCTGETVF